LLVGAERKVAALPRLVEYLCTLNRGQSIADPPKRGRGRPRTGIGPAISMRLYPELEAALKAWIARQPDPKPSRSEALRRLVEKGLEGERR
jgi:hypothetical protein